MGKLAKELPVSGGGNLEPPVQGIVIFDVSFVNELFRTV